MPISFDNEEMFAAYIERIFYGNYQARLFGASENAANLCSEVKTVASSAARNFESEPRARPVQVSPLNLKNLLPKRTATAATAEAKPANRP